MNIKRLMIAAPKSGSGKTIVTCALLQTLKNAGHQVHAFKCGPDYIDPMFHAKTLGVPTGNLDTFFTTEEDTVRIFMDNVLKADFAVFEGVMGLYDGLGGVREEGSSYHLAKVTKTPIILVVDAKGMGRSVIPLLAGFLAYDKEHLIRGVLLNRISERYYETVKPLLEEELKIKAVGFLPDKKELSVESRHLGLVMPDELDDIKERIQAVSKEFLRTVSVKDMITIAEGAETLMPDEPAIAEALASEESAGIAKSLDSDSNRKIAKFVREAASGKKAARKQQDVTIAVARDEAFCFYYAENLRLLAENGARLTYFSPLHDQKLPDGCHALLLGGGYPELYAKELNANRKMRLAVKTAVDGGMPVVAECGGFLYLHSAIIDWEGRSYEMAGVIPETCFDTGKLVRFGYLELREKQPLFLPTGEKIKGHEFHYYDSACNGEDAIALKPVTGKEYSCMIETENRFMGFPHLYYPSNPAFVRAFVGKAEQYKKRMEEKMSAKEM